tara:strand:- start:6543 stop:6782 length:240 start_codon:yes stop_codon:yes gene_type:complete
MSVKKSIKNVKKSLKYVKKTSKRGLKNVKKTSKKVKNDFFKIMLKAKKQSLPSFLYNGKTYKKNNGKGNKSHLVFYSSK